MKRIPARPKYVLLFAALWMILLAACNARPATTPTAARTATPSHTPTASKTPTLTLTATVTSTATKTSRPTATQDISPGKPFATLGEGLANEVVRSPDGSMLALLEGAWGDAPRLQWFDATTNKQLGSVQLNAGTGIEGFSADNHWIVVDGIYGAIIVNTVTGDIQNCCSGINGPSFGFRFSVDNHYLAYTGADRSTGGPYHFVGIFPLDPAYAFPLEEDEFGGIHLYAIANEDNYHLMTAPAISPDNRWLAAGYRDTGNNLLYLWGLKTGAVQFAIPHIAEINSVDFSPDGRYLASGGDDGVLRLFSVGSGLLDRAVTGFTGYIGRIRFSADGRQIEVADRVQGDLIYDLASGQITPLTTPEPTPDPFLATMHRQGYADGDGVLFGPDGKTLALGGQSVQLWDLAGKRVKLSIENPSGTLLGWAFSADGSRLAGISEHGDVLAWDTASGELLLKQSADLLPIGQAYYASGAGLGMGIGAGMFTNQGLAFSPDSKQIAFGDGNAIEIWDIENASLVRRLEQPEAPAYATRVSFSADGRRLYSIINRNRGAQIWDIARGTLLEELDLPGVDPNAFTATALHGPLFARNNYAGESHWVELWNLEQGKMFKLPVPDQAEPFHFSPNGSLLIAISQNTLYFWQTASGELIDYMPLEASLPGLSISPDNATLAIGQDGKAQLFDISAIHNAAGQETLPPVAAPPTATPWSGYTEETPVPTQRVVFTETLTLPAGAISTENISQLVETSHFGRGVVSEIAWSNAPGVTLLTSGPLGVYAFDGSPLAEAAHFPTGRWMEALVSLPNGEVLAAGAFSQSVQAWNLSTDSLLAELPGFGPLQLSAGGDLLVYGDDKGNLHSYDLAAGQEITTLHTTYQASLPVISPDGRLVAAVDGWSNRLQTQNYVRIWDAHSGTIVNAVGGPDAAITDLAFSADGKFVIGTAGGTAWVWDIRPEVSRPYRIDLYPSELNGNLVLYHQRVTAAALSPDNRLLAVGDSERNIWLYEIATSKPIHRLQGHAAPLYRLRFSADGARLLSADSDGRIATWNISSGATVASLEAHTGPIRNVITGLDGNLRAWAGNTAWTLDPLNGALLHTTSVYSGTVLTASPAGDWLAVSNRLQMSLWDANTGEFGQMLEGEAGDPFVDHMYEGLVLRGFFGASFRFDGTKLFTHAPGEQWTYESQADGTFKLVESTYATLYLQEGIAGARTPFESDTSPDGNWSVSFKQAYEPAPLLVLWNHRSHEEVNQLAFPEGAYLTTVTFSPDGRLVAIGQADGSIAFVDLAAWQVIASFDGHNSTINAIIFASDGKTMITAGEDGLVKFWAVGDER